MNTSFYSEVSGQLLFTVFDSRKTAKSGQFRVHHHAGLIVGSRLQAPVNQEVPIRHHFPDMREPMEAIRTLAADPEENRFEIRHALLTLPMTLTRLMLPKGIAPEKMEISRRLADVQRAVAYIHEHLAEPITPEEIARGRI